MNKIFPKKLQKGDGDYGHNTREYNFYRGSAVYGCLWRKTGGNPKYTCEADSPQRRDSDCSETILGKNCITFLSKRERKTEKVTVL